LLPRFIDPQGEHKSKQWFCEGKIIKGLHTDGSDNHWKNLIAQPRNLSNPFEKEDHTQFSDLIGKIEESPNCKTVCETKSVGHKSPLA
jgi:hypothetical protein